MKWGRSRSMIDGVWVFFVLLYLPLVLVGRFYTHMAKLF